MRRIALPVIFGLLVTAGAAVPVAARRGPVIVYSRGSAAPSFVGNISSTALNQRPVSAALHHLASEPARYRITSPRVSLRPVAVERSDAMTHVRLAQHHRGVPVWGAQYLVHMTPSAEGFVPRTVNGHVFTELQVPVQPLFNEVVARRLASLRVHPVSIRKLHPHGLTVLPLGTGVLAYHFTAEASFLGRPLQEEIFINARTGALALSFNNLQHDGAVVVNGRTSHGKTVPLGAYQRGSVIEMRDQSKPMFATSGGEITTHDANGTSRHLATDLNIVKTITGSFTGDATRSGAVDAHHGASLTYDFFKALGRDSLDGAGMDIRSTVDVTEPRRVPMYNAFWDGINKQMVYGNPDPSQFHPFSGDLDVVGHELTHGVTQHSGNLAYVGQSGAMNEAYSDYFGNAIDVIEAGTPMSDRAAGYIGEDLCKSNQTDAFTCPLRDLNDDATTEDYIYFLADLDNGGVHINSTIYGGALWDIREALGADADRYIYRALEAYTTPLDHFMDGRNSILAAAQELGASVDHQDAIAAAFDAHGITENWDVAPTNDGTVIVSDVAPVSDLGFSEPQLSGQRFVIADYADKAQMCCVGLQIFTGTIDGSEAISRMSLSEPSEVMTEEAPDVSGNRAVWHRVHLRNARAVRSEIVVRKVGGAERTIAAGDMVVNPSIDDNLVAWEVFGRNSDIKARYLGRRARTVIESKADQILPTVAGDWVAWWDLRSRIGIKNMATGRRRSVRPRDPYTIVGPPSLTERYVFWFQMGLFEARGSIMRMDLRTGKKKALVRASSEDAPVWALSITLPPVVSANDTFAVYSTEMDYLLEFGGRPNATDKDQVGRDVFIVPIQGGDSVNITSNRGDQAHPLMGEGRRVVWLDSAEGQTDLVTREVP